MRKKVIKMIAKKSKKVCILKLRKRRVYQSYSVYYSLVYCCLGLLILYCPSQGWSRITLINTPVHSTLKITDFSRLKEVKPPQIPLGLWCLYVAYPDQIHHVDHQGIFWKEGEYLKWTDPMNLKSQKTIPKIQNTSMTTIDATFIESFTSYSNRLNTATLQDQMTQVYPLSFSFPKPLPPQFDPGRIRHLPFFYKMYGATRREVGRSLVPVKWPFSKQTIKVTTINQVDQRIKAIIQDLKTLPLQFKKYFHKTAGVFYWRMIKGTQRRSLHSFGIAIDIGVQFANYWKWTRKVKGRIPYKNQFPQEVVHLFEQYGFIWGGKWYHHDTMHFEYRPELSVCTYLKDQSRLGTR